eukprot:634156-Rhodomonas_salina.1
MLYQARSRLRLGQKSVCHARATLRPRSAAALPASASAASQVRAPARRASNGLTQSEIKHRKPHSWHTSHRENVFDFGLYRVRVDLQADVIIWLSAGYSGPASGPCTACGPGTYKESEGAGECVMCPVGSFQDAEAGTSCVTCPVGQYRDPSGSAAEVTCIACPASAVPAAEGGCVFPCAENEFLDGDACSPCPANMVSQAGQVNTLLFRPSQTSVSLV